MRISFDANLEIDPFGGWRPPPMKRLVDAILDYVVPVLPAVLQSIFPPPKAEGKDE